MQLVFKVVVGFSKPRKELHQMTIKELNAENFEDGFKKIISSITSQLSD